MPISAMGLCLGWSLKLGAKHDPVRILERLRQTALDLPFDSVSDAVLSLEGQECILGPADEREPPRGLCLPERDYLLIVGARHVQLGPNLTPYVSIPPLALHSFRVLPGPRCEPAIFYLARYPRTHTGDGHTVVLPRGPTWSSSSHTKTQYASNHGLDVFLRCHLGLIALLDRARDLGLRVSVRDDGGFDRSRSVPKLIAALNGWNELVAGLRAALSAALPEGVHASGGLTGRPDLERLEARGLGRFRELAAFVKKLHSRRG